MSGWERTFIKPKINVEQTRIPDIGGDVAAGFRLQTEERVAREKADKENERRSTEIDTALREEMHSFGMIECEYFDPETKMIKLEFAANEGFSVSARSFPYGNYTDRTWSSSEVSVGGKFGKGEVVFLRPKKIIEDDTGFVTEIDCEEIAILNDKSFKIKLVITRPIVDVQSGKATMFLTLGSAYGDGDALVVPDLASKTELSYPYENLVFYK